MYQSVHTQETISNYDACCTQNGQNFNQYQETKGDILPKKRTDNSRLLTLQSTRTQFLDTYIFVYKCNELCLSECTLSHPFNLTLPIALKQCDWT